MIGASLSVYHNPELDFLGIVYSILSTLAACLSAISSEKVFFFFFFFFFFFGEMCLDMVFLSLGLFFLISFSFFKNKTKQNKTKQNKTKQNNTKQKKKMMKDSKMTPTQLTFFSSIPAIFILLSLMEGHELTRLVFVLVLFSFLFCFCFCYCFCSCFVAFRFALFFFFFSL